MLIHAGSTHRIRCVTHRDLDAAAVRRAADVLCTLIGSALSATG